MVMQCRKDVSTNDKLTLPVAGGKNMKISRINENKPKNIPSKMAEALLTALKPEKFQVSKKGDPDVLLTEFNEYVKKF